MGNCRNSRAQHSGTNRDVQPRSAAIHERSAVWCSADQLRLPGENEAAPGRRKAATGSALHISSCAIQDFVTMNVLNSTPVEGAVDVPPIARVAVTLLNGTEIEPPPYVPLETGRDRSCTLYTV